MFLFFVAMELCKEEHPDYFPGVLLDSWSTFTYRGIYCCYMISFDQHGFGRYGHVENVILALRSDLGSDFSPYSFNLEVGQGSLNVTLQRICNITLSAYQVTSNSFKSFKSEKLKLIPFAYSMVHFDSKYLLFINEVSFYNYELNI